MEALSVDDYLNEEAGLVDIAFSNQD